ncbi:transcriptional regulator [Spongiibacter sp. KMU-166]|uniref:Transcriptional regulator n=1 Tax=Spongiibacter thalassae TaxID=2721624 RepID=A0ABX1GDZ9_9GAMM|nr:transcriptional regulator [Spongiibacter thalassae]NKI17410.1 transcriptional regulator [Spongiibacter thalassae]
MAKRDMFAELMQGMDDLKTEREGKITLKKTELSVLPEVELSAAEVAGIRDSLNMSQPVFARVIRANKRTYERYETQGVKGPQAVLIKLVGRNPAILKELEAL